MPVEKAQILEVIERLEREYPDASIALNYEGNWQLLVAVILSAQCTDVRVNMVTPALFKRFPEVEDFEACDLAELEKMIYSTGFYRNKAKNIRAAAMRVVTEFGGVVPDKMVDLLSLAGVARKTANVVLNAAFGRQEGIVVDTHVARLAGLLGWVPMKYSKTKNALKIEGLLIKLLPRDKWAVISYLLILHGRNVCISRRPQCGECVLKDLCPSRVS
jgi:endonuclease III